MSLYGNNTAHMWGTIRNAQLVPVHLPGWRLRVYVPDADVATDDNGRPTSLPEVPEAWRVDRRVIDCLRRLGAEVVRVRPSADETPPTPPPAWWSYLVVDDPAVEYFLVRHAVGRPSDREAVAVEDWLVVAHQQTEIAVHCIRDHPRHAAVVLTDGLWGGRTETLRLLLGWKTLRSLVVEYVRREEAAAAASSNVDDRSAVGSNRTRTFGRRTRFLNDILLPRLRLNNVYCHDGVACRHRSGSFPFPVERRPATDDTPAYVGQTFDEHQIANSFDASLVNTSAPNCFRMVTVKQPSLLKSSSKNPPLQVTVQRPSQLRPSSKNPQLQLKKKKKAKKPISGSRKSKKVILTVKH